MSRIPSDIRPTSEIISDEPVGIHVFFSQGWENFLKEIFDFSDPTTQRNLQRLKILRKEEEKDNHVAERSTTKRKEQNAPTAVPQAKLAKATRGQRGVVRVPMASDAAMAKFHEIVQQNANLTQEVANMKKELSNTQDQEMKEDEGLQAYKFFNPSTTTPAETEAFFDADEQMDTDQTKVNESQAALDRMTDRQKETEDKLTEQTKEIQKNNKEIEKLRKKLDKLGENKEAEQKNTSEKISKLVAAQSQTSSQAETTLTKLEAINSSIAMLKKAQGTESVADVLAKQKKLADDNMRLASEFRSIASDIRSAMKSSESETRANIGVLASDLMKTNTNIAQQLNDMKQLNDDKMMRHLDRLEKKIDRESETLRKRSAKEISTIEKRRLLAEEHMHKQIQKAEENMIRKFRRSESDNKQLMEIARGNSEALESMLYQISNIQSKKEALFSLGQIQQRVALLDSGLASRLKMLTDRVDRTVWDSSKIPAISNELMAMRTAMENQIYNLSQQNIEYAKAIEDIKNKSTVAQLESEIDNMFDALAPPPDRAPITAPAPLLPLTSPAPSSSVLADIHQPPEDMSVEMPSMRTKRHADTDADADTDNDDDIRTKKPQEYVVISEEKDEPVTTQVKQANIRKNR